MDKNNFKDVILGKLNAVLDDMKNNPENITDDERSMLENLYSSLCKTMGISEHTQWRVQWKVEKWLDSAKHILGFAPDEVCVDTQNIILDSGANEMLNLIAGTGGTAYSAANTYIYVGSDSSMENAAQVGILATSPNRAAAKVDSGFPQVNGRQVEYRATFTENEANFAWNEVSIVNGPTTATNAVAMNRKVVSMGTKVTGTWAVSITISLTSST